MSLKLLFSRHTRHLQILAFLILAGGGVAAFVRSQLVPQTFGDIGPYPVEALEREANKPMIHVADHVCLECHTDVEEARAESPHKAVACFHCHGYGSEHVKAAKLAAEDPEKEIPSAQEWDGDFRTHADLFVTQDRATCLSCHMRVVGMSEAFRSINVAEHLEEQGAEEVDGRNVCFECHDGHSPGL